MKLTFKMTADEFYKGYNYKIQKIGLNNMAEIVSLVVIMIASIVASVLGVVNAMVICLLRFWFAYFLFINKLRQKTAFQPNFSTQLY